MIPDLESGYDDHDDDLAQLVDKLHDELPVNPLDLIPGQGIQPDNEPSPRVAGPNTWGRVGKFKKEDLVLARYHFFGQRAPTSAEDIKAQAFVTTYLNTNVSRIAEELDDQSLNNPVTNRGMTIGLSLAPPHLPAPAAFGPVWREDRLTWRLSAGGLWDGPSSRTFLPNAGLDWFKDNLNLNESEESEKREEPTQTMQLPTVPTPKRLKNG